MKLLQIKIKNIASLQGLHEINFSLIEKSSSLFAITGETGSGKSTILNAISLALFGEVYKKNVNQMDLVTLGEKEAEIQLILMMKNQTYLADWKARIRKQDGEYLKQPLIQRALFKLSEASFEAGREIVEEPIESLLMMNFDQFCKCIILNQGEFARFLTSSFTERKEILERLYPGEIFDNLSKIIKKDLDESIQKIHEITLKLEEIQFNPINFDNLNKLIAEETKKKQEFEVYLKELEGISQDLNSLNYSHQKFHEHRERKEKLENELGIEINYFNEVLKEKDKIKQDYHELKKQSDIEIPKLQKLLKKEEELLHKKEFLKNLLHQKEALQVELKKYQSEILDEEKELNKIIIINEDLISQFNISPYLIVSHFNDIQKYLEASLAFLEKNNQLNFMSEQLMEAQNKGLATKKNIEIVEQKIKDYPSQLQSMLNELNKTKTNILEQNEKIKSAKIRFTEIDKKYEDTVISIKETDYELSKLLEHEKTLKNESEQFSKAEAKNLLNQSIENCLKYIETHKLKDCPVCLQKLSKDPLNNVSAKHLQDQSIHNHTKGLEENLLILKELSDKIQFQQFQHRNLCEILEQLKNERNQVAKLAECTVQSTNNLDEEIQQTQKSIWDLEKAEIDLARLKIELQDERAEYLKIKDSKEKIQVSIEELNKTILSLKNKSQEIFLAEPNVNEISILQKDLNLSLSFNQNDLKIKNINSQIKTKQNIAEEYLSKINQLNVSQNELAIEIDKISHELELSNNGKSITEVLNHLREELSIQELKLNDIEKLFIEKETLQKEFQTKISTHQEQIKDYELLFLKHVFVIKNKSLELLRLDLFKSIEVLQKLSLFEANIHFSSELLGLVEKNFLDKKNSFKIQLEESQIQLATLEQQLKDQMILKERSDKLMESKRLFEKEMDEAKLWAQILGKDELRSFVLALVEKNLVIQTNNELEHLCQGRYKIVQQHKNSKLTPEFYILDKYKNGEKRKVSTLSGGETFMVSLAMALALADITRGHAEINTLFIDEGFGTLDQDSLMDVIEVLNQIQSRGLMIGLISHVKMLTDSLPVNLHLTKRSNGTSSVSIKLFADN